MRGKAVDANYAKPPPSKQFQKAYRPFPAATPTVLIPDQGEDRVATLAEITERRAKSKAHHRAVRKVTPPAVEAVEGEDSPSSPALWLLDTLRILDEQDAQTRSEQTRIFVNQKVQRQPLPSLSELLERVVASITRKPPLRDRVTYRPPVDAQAIANLDRHLT
ncbi:hypothetical protein DESA109040_18565 [Deinococcus saxicola]|uniref:hypothetical protein n=1 Tax=Deinococcus saxicola TaxID=249406 RepID=UPI0039EFC0DC